MAMRSFATGPASGGTISDDLLQKLGGLSTQALVDGLWVMGWPSAQIDGARPLAPGMKCVGRAVTLNFVPARPDIAQDKPAGGESPEYEAFEKCGPNEVLVMSSTGPWESVGGDIKFLRLKQREIGGLVTDGSVRDTDEIIDYGFPCFSYSTTARQGPAAMQPWECNGVVSVSGVTVRPGDAIVGDQDGVVCVPAKVAETVYSIAHGREVIEDIVKEELTKNPGPPGKFYPFMSGRSRSIPLLDNSLPPRESPLRTRTNSKELPIGEQCTRKRTNANSAKFTLGPLFASKRIALNSSLFERPLNVSD
jgi:regulator of RNase E activity RraA